MFGPRYKSSNRSQRLRLSWRKREMLPSCGFLSGHVYNSIHSEASGSCIIMRNVDKVILIIQLFFF